MSTYFLALLVAIWDWVFDPPLQWLLSLSREWQIELVILFILVFFCVRIVENVFIGRELTGEWWAERRRRKEWFAVGSMEPDEFRDYVTALRREADKHIRLAERLEDRGGRGFKSYVLHRAAWRRQMRAQALLDEADRLESLWKAIEKERENGDNDAARTKVLRLMRRLDSVDDHTAHEALNELRRMGNSFNWESLAPREMLQPRREQLMKLLRLMAGTSNLSEARSAHSKAFRLLDEGGWGRRWEVA